MAPELFDSDLLPYNVIIMAEEQFELLQEWGQGSPAHLESDNLVLQANASDLLQEMSSTQGSVVLLA